MIASLIASATVVGLLDDFLVALPRPVDDLAVTVSMGLGALGHPVRREVLAILSERRRVTRSELVERIDVAKVPHDEAKHLRITLHHVHLPKLDAEQLIEYDPRSGDVVLRADPGSIQSDLESWTAE